MHPNYIEIMRRDWNRQVHHGNRSAMQACAIKCISYLTECVCALCMYIICVKLVQSLQFNNFKLIHDDVGKCDALGTIFLFEMYSRPCPAQIAGSSWVRIANGQLNAFRMLSSREYVYLSLGVCECVCEYVCTFMFGYKLYSPAGFDCYLFLSLSEKRVSNDLRLVAARIDNAPRLVHIIC